MLLVPINNKTSSSQMLNSAKQVSHVDSLLIADHSFRYFRG